MTGEPFDEVCIVVGLVAQVVVDVSDGELKLPSPARGEDGQSAEQGDGIGTAGDGKKQVVAFAHVASPAQGVGE